MSVDWIATTFIGCKIDEPTVKSKRRLCRHKIQDTLYCPDCGQKMWEEYEEIQPLIEKLENNECPTITVYNYEDNYYVGMFYSQADEGEAKLLRLSDGLTILELKNHLEKVLGELWNEKNFGLWTILNAY